jgi:hypothetical protein
VKRSKRTPIVEKKMRPGELLERGEGIATGPPAGVDLGAPTESGPAIPVPPPVPQSTVDREAIRRARELRPELDRVTEQLNAEIALAEQAVRGLRLGVAGTVPISVDGDRTDALSWARHGGDWGFTYDVTVAGALERTPLLRSSRAQRLRAVPFFAALVNELARNVDVELERVRAAHAQYADFAETLAKHAAGGSEKP